MQVVSLSANRPELELRATQESSQRVLTPTSASSVELADIPVCFSLENMISSCEGHSPGFSLMSATDKASCLCYNQSAWSPKGFDGAILTCANYVATSAPSLYPPLTGIEGLCSSLGDVRTQSSSSSNQISLTSGSASTTRPPPASPTAGVGLSTKATLTATATQTQTAPSVGNGDGFHGMVSLEYQGHR
jgi:hypothetical protein